MPFRVSAIMAVGWPWWRELGKGGADLIEIVAVGKLHHVELKGAELVGERHGVVDLLDGTVDLQAVVVDDHTEVIELLVAGKHGGLPDLALLALAIAQQGVRAISIAPVLGGNGHAHAAEMPWPSEPVDMSTPGVSFMLG